MIGNNIMIICKGTALFCGIIVLGWTLYDIVMTLFILPNRKYQLASTKTKICDAIIRWGLKNIDPHLSKERINLKVSYYQHKKLMGVFYSHNCLINIYINNHQDIRQIIDTVLHEVVHYKQYCRNPKNFNCTYTKQLQEIGYDKHPMEIEARRIAVEKTNTCLEYIVRVGLVEKKKLVH
jgi:hypothetical protein